MSEKEKNLLLSVAEQLEKVDLDKLSTIISPELRRSLIQSFANNGVLSVDADSLTDEFTEISDIHTRSQMANEPEETVIVITASY